MTRYVKLITPAAESPQGIEKAIYVDADRVVAVLEGEDGIEFDEILVGSDMSVIRILRGTALDALGIPR